MIYRVFEKAELSRLFAALSAAHPVVGPVEKARDRMGSPVFAFEKIKNFADLRLNYTTTKSSAKQYFLPHKENMAIFSLAGDDWTKTISYNMDRPCIFWGLHACDINALNKLDKVLLHSVYPMPYYAAKRRNIFIIGIDCMPQPSCFCRSMGADTVLHGFDMFLTDIGGHYFAEVLSDTAYNFLKEIRTEEPDDSYQALFMKRVNEKNRKFSTSVDTTDLTIILDIEFQSHVWKQWGDKCLGCGACASVCPTCYCYGVEECVDIDLRTARKEKSLYACTLIDFAQVAGGHNFRPDRASRLKYRYYHKHRGFVEAYEESLCVGCGRCGESCLAGITVPEVIDSVRKEMSDG